MKPKYPWAEAMGVAEELVNCLQPACSRIWIAGSLRREKKMVGDIEILCVPREQVFLDTVTVCTDRLIRMRILNFRLNARGSRVYGLKNKLLTHIRSGIPVDIFSTDEECWSVALVVRTGSKESNIAIATAALRKGWRLHAYGTGFTDEHGNEIKCHSEQDVFELVGLPYKEPWERG